MENLRPEEETINEDVRNLYRSEKLKKETTHTTIKGIKNLFRLQKENKAIKYIILRDIRNFFKHKEEENYYKPVRVSNFWSNNYVEYESNGDRNKTLSDKEY